MNTYTIVLPIIIIAIICIFLLVKKRVLPILRKRGEEKKPQIVLRPSRTTPPEIVLGPPTSKVQPEDNLEIVIGESRPISTNNAGIPRQTSSTEIGRICPICQCKMALNDIVIQCLSCHIVYHKECLEYYGRCSTVGCKENRKK